MAFIFIPVKLFKIQGFVMQGRVTYYSISRIHTHFLVENHRCHVFEECEIIEYSVVNNVTMGTTKG